MAQITWKNVNAPNVSGAVALQRMGQQNISQGISGLTGVAEGVRDTYQGNIEEDLTRQLAQADTVEGTQDFIAKLQGADIDDTTGFLKEAMAKGKTIEAEDMAMFEDNLTGMLAQAKTEDDLVAITDMVDNSKSKNKGKFKQTIELQRDSIKEEVQENLKTGYFNTLQGTQDPSELDGIREAIKADPDLKNKAPLLKAVETRGIEITLAETREYNQKQANLMRNSDEGITQVLDQFHGNDAVKARSVLHSKQWYQDLDTPYREQVDQAFNSRFDATRELGKEATSALLAHDTETLEIKSKADKLLAQYEADISNVAGVTNFRIVSPTEGQAKSFSSKYFNEDGDLNTDVKAVQIVTKALNGRTPTPAEFQQIMFSAGPTGFWSDLVTTDEGWIEKAAEDYATQLSQSKGEKLTKYLDDYYAERDRLYADINLRNSAREKAELALVEAKVEGVGRIVDPRKELAYQLNVLNNGHSTTKVNGEHVDTTGGSKPTEEVEEELTVTEPEVDTSNMTEEEKFNYSLSQDPLGRAYREDKKLRDKRRDALRKQRAEEQEKRQIRLGEQFLNSRSKI